MGSVPAGEQRGAGQPLAKAAGGRLPCRSWVCAPGMAQPLNSLLCCEVPFNDTRLMRRASGDVIQPGGMEESSKRVCLYRSTPVLQKTPLPPQCLLPGWLPGDTNPSPFPNVLWGKDPSSSVLLWKKAEVSPDVHSCLNSLSPLLFLVTFSRNNGDNNSRTALPRPWTQQTARSVFQWDRKGKKYLHIGCITSQLKLHGDFFSLLLVAFSVT